MGGRSVIRQRFRSHATAGVVLAVGLTLTGLVAWRWFKSGREQDLARFHRQTQQTVEALRSRCEKYELALTSLAEFVAARPTLTEPEWRFRMRVLWPERNYPGLLEIGLAELTPSTNERARTGGSLRVRHSWVRPPSGFDGLDTRFLEAPAIEVLIRHALQTGEPVLSPRRGLSSEIGGTLAQGFTLFVPVSHRWEGLGATSQPEPAAASTLEPPLSQAAGMVMGSIEPGLLLEHLFGTAPREVDFDAFAPGPPSTATWLNRRAGSPLTLNPDFRPYLATEISFDFRGQPLTLRFYTTPLFEQQSARDRPWLALVAGSGWSVVMTLLLLVQIRARVRQEGIAAELRATSLDLQRAHAERERISRDLHDGAIQSLYGLQLSLGRCERMLTRKPDTAQELLGHCRLEVDALIDELRQFLVDHPAREGPEQAWVDAGTALPQFVERFRQATTVPIEVEIHDSPPTLLSPHRQLHLRQVLQESLSNSLRHGQPRKVRVEWCRAATQVRLTITDDGAGFDSARTPGTGHGLANLRARAVELHAWLTVTSQSGQGTCVTLDFPVEPIDPPPHD
jgi:signal transduction histidine kinase